MAKSREEMNEYNRNWYAKKKEENGGINPFRETRKRYYQDNKDEFAERSREWYGDSAHKILLRERKFKINFQELVEAQNNKCGICDSEFTDYSQVHIDHDHDTGFIRGLLCKQHNRGLGFFNDDWELLEKAARWVFQGKVRHLNG